MQVWLSSRGEDRLPTVRCCWVFAVSLIGLRNQRQIIMPDNETSASSVVAIAARQDMTDSGLSFAARYRNGGTDDLLRWC